MVTSPSTCCVLGATGFIGGHVARAALARGWSVRALRRRPEATGAIGDLEVDWVLGDLYDPPSLVEAMAGCRVVFHSAGYYPTRRSSVRAAVEHAVAGVRNVLDAASEAGVDRLVYTGVFTTVGPPDDPARMANEGDAYTPGSVPNRYYESKWAMEREILGAAPAGLETIALLPTAVLGPGDVKPTTGGLLLAAGRGLLLGYVDAVTNIIDVRDVAAAHIAAAEQGTWRALHRGRPQRDRPRGPDGRRQSSRSEAAHPAAPHVLGSGRRAPGRIPRHIWHRPPGCDPLLARRRFNQGPPRAGIGGADSLGTDLQRHAGLVPAARLSVAGA
ncbi:MAG: NAD-dependent epimerase/dehydratase family protein [Anaerolineales bacterium]|nr:MAG: NAD-dependent epimerase/dehydratase family protein [Anaerolineales bacterium]